MNDTELKQEIENLRADLNLANAQTRQAEAETRRTRIEMGLVISELNHELAKLKKEKPHG